MAAPISAAPGRWPGTTAAALARAGAVVVGVNYRLGPLGMLHVPPVARGDLLLRDIEAALAWVRAEIGAFGGDPGCVTLMGQSAGAHAIMCLLVPRHGRVPSGGAAQSAGLGAAVLGVRRPERGARGSWPNWTSRRRRFRPCRWRGCWRLRAGMLRAMARFGEVRVPFLPMVDGVNTDEAFIDQTARVAVERGIPLIVGTHAR